MNLEQFFLLSALVLIAPHLDRPAGLIIGSLLTAAVLVMIIFNL